MSNNNKPECPICMNPITRPYYAHKNNGGKMHPFHKRCLMKYIEGQQESTCPVCRKNLTNQNMNNINANNNISNNSNLGNGVNIRPLMDPVDTIITRDWLGLNPNEYVHFSVHFRNPNMTPRMRYVMKDKNTHETILSNKGSDERLAALPRKILGLVRAIGYNKNYYYLQYNIQNDFHYVNYLPENLNYLRYGEDLRFSTEWLRDENENNQNDIEIEY
jgi:hypothetical protein